MCTTGKNIAQYKLIQLCKLNQQGSVKKQYIFMKGKQKLLTGLNIKKVRTTARHIQHIQHREKCVAY